MCFVTGTQMGKTETYLDLIGAKLAMKPAPVGYVGPTKEMVTDQFEPRLMTMLDESPDLADKVIRGRRMKKTQKWVAGVRLRLMHGRSSTALKSDAYALILVDEYDEMLSNLLGQGDPLGLVLGRGYSYADFRVGVTSSPSQGLVETRKDPVSGLEFWRMIDEEDLAGMRSQIWKLFQSGTMFHFAWPCPHCGEFFIPMMKHLGYAKDATPAQAKRKSWLVCPRNGCIIEDDAKGELKATMNARGVFVAPGQTIDKDGRVQGDAPDVPTCSFWTSGLCSPFVPWGERAEAYLTAVKTGDENQIQTAVNTNFGECYAMGMLGGEMADWRFIKEKKAFPYIMAEAQVPRFVIRTTMGVDVGKWDLWWVLRGWGEGGKSALLNRGRLLGPTSEWDIWRELEPIFHTPYAGIVPERVFIDSGFRADKPDQGDQHIIYEFCKLWPRWCFPCKGHDIQKEPFKLVNFEVTSNGKKLGWSVPLIHLNTDYFKSLVHSRILKGVELPGSFCVPSDVDEEYCRHLVSERRILDKITAKPTWVKFSKANHFFDCETLAAAAGFMLNVQAIPLGTARNWDPEPVVGTGGSEDRGALAPAGARVNTPAAPPPPPPSRIGERFAKYGNPVGR